MERENENGASAGATAADDARELRELEERRQAIERRQSERARAARGPRDREEQFVSGMVELAQGAAQGRSVHELRDRAAKVLDALKG